MKKENLSRGANSHREEWKREFLIDSKKDCVSLQIKQEMLTFSDEKSEIKIYYTRKTPVLALRLNLNFTLISGH